ncbi:Starch-binding associating with outer membrane [Parapedobacter luteus]|uniref:Starch-binding associating with outer membrane n=1 Tax=Parapedobacter luteus TaxID=623280 RepID=A0A1T5BRN4_9SPHI|nr:RagB/SusD family nutrient uptake outer membrane protein [Parapedobacter luteus]SKB49779.1 Starch-binding associating with outer membrane [Parapedobacter luteus]
MKKSSIFNVLLLAGGLTCVSSCSDFLEREPDEILTDDQVFSDAIMIESVLANFYGRVTWSQHIGDWYQYTVLDEAGKSDGGPDNIQNYDNAQWRVYDYTLIRNINQFLQSLRATTVITDTEKQVYEGEVRFLRAWTYFNMARGLGGMPIVGDEVFDYQGGMDITTLQYPRSTEAGIYDYIIEECDAVSAMLDEEKTINSARANKWTALMLKARAAIYAGSLANYNNKMSSPIRTAGGEVGISAEHAEGYYQQALAAAQEVINNSPYQLQLNKPDDLERNFYEATSVKDNNTEVIWARDYRYPGQTVGFTTQNIPGSHAEDIDRAAAGPILNLVEDFEYVNNRDGSIQIRDNQGNYIFYDDPADAFANKDARLGGSVITPNAVFKGTPVELQAGQKVWSNGAWQTIAGQPGERDGQGRLITSSNGPNRSNEQYINKTGFFFRKFLDEAAGASTRGRNSEMWFPRFRFAEALLIAAEAAMELGQQPVAVGYINQVRERAGIQPLTSVTLDDIIQERRVEFAFEDHRYWDLKRWRRAHIVWNGVVNSPTAQHWALFPYLVVAPGTPNDGKYVFDRLTFSNSLHPRFFELRNYYNFIDLAWQNANPKIVLNPFQ